MQYLPLLRLQTEATVTNQCKCDQQQLDGSWNV